MSLSSYKRSIQENFQSILIININFIIAAYSVFICYAFFKEAGAFQGFIASNLLDLKVRTSFLKWAIGIFLLLNAAIIICSSNKKVLGYMRKGSLLVSGLLFFVSYILVSKPELTDKFAFISIIIAVGYLVYVYKELEALSVAQKIAPDANAKVIRAVKILSFTFAGLYILYFSVLSVLVYMTFESPTHDGGIFVNILHNISRFKPAYFSIYDINFFEHHFSPILYLLIPFFWIHPGSITLLIIQSVVLGLASLYLYRLVKHVSKNEILALCIQVSYLLNPAVHGTNLFDFHEVAFLPLFLFGMLYYYEKGNQAGYWIFFGLALLIKEDVPIFMAVFGAYIGLIRGDRKTGIITLVIAAVYYLTVKQFLTHGVLFSRYNEMMIEGMDPEKGIIVSLLTNPIFLIDFIVSNKLKIAFIIIISLPLLFLPFRSGIALMLLVPAVIYGLLTNYELHFKVNFHNPLPFIPVLYYLAALSLPKLKLNYMLLGLMIVISSMGANAFFGSVHPKAKPITELYKKELKRDVFNSVLSKIPANASVSAPLQIVPHLCNRDSVFTFPFLLWQDTNGKMFYDEGRTPKYSSTNEATYVMWDNKYSWCWPLPSHEYGMDMIRQLGASGKYGLLYSYGGLYLLKKGYPTTNNAELNKYPSICLPREFGEEVKDTGTVTGFALVARPGDLVNGDRFLTWGPYIKLAAGRHKIDFRFKVDNNTGEEAVLALEVYKHPGIYIATKEIKASDFSASNQYQLFSLEVDTPSELDNIEFRVLYKGKKSIWMDYILPEKIN